MDASLFTQIGNSPGNVTDLTDRAVEERGVEVGKVELSAKMKTDLYIADDVRTEGARPLIHLIQSCQP